MKIPCPVIVGMIIAAGLISSPAQTVTISNEMLRADFDTAAERFTIVQQATQLSFVSGGQFIATGGVASVQTTSSALFGSGQLIDIAYPAGNHNQILLFTNLPFALFQTTISNGSSQVVISNKMITMTAIEDWGEPETNLIVM